MIACFIFGTKGNSWNVDILNMSDGRVSTILLITEIVLSITRLSTISVIVKEYYYAIVWSWPILQLWNYVGRVNVYTPRISILKNCTDV